MSHCEEERTDFARIGGQEGLERIIHRFIQRVYDDMIIGFFFVRIDKENLIAREVEFAARHLGGPSQYSGRPIGVVHKKHPINRGHFHRRLWLLSEVLKEFKVPEDIQTSWLAHNRQLESMVTDGSDCVV